MIIKRFSFFVFLLCLTITGQVVSAEYVGTSACAACHDGEYKSWQGSHHDMSMRHAIPDAVLGNFDSAEISFNNETSKFYRKGNEYWVNIKGADGKFHDYQIKYTFGYEPLQQYMVEFDDGRVQLIPFAWDSRSKVKGGQRWFYLYPEFTDNREEFFWTNYGQNWNYMCADCHSTNVSKNYDPSSNKYNTSFSEINVGCEACHGPGSQHIEWTKKKAGAVKEKGFDRDLNKAVSHWVKREGKNTLFPEKIKHSHQTLVCAQCHSRHIQISDNDFVKDKAFGDRYLLSMVNGEQYYADGQIYDEVFVYGSFLQSKMSQNGVVCSNCHEPHSNKLIVQGDAVCLQCHQAESYATKKHHNHLQDSSGAQCVNCHMPETIYMQVDARRDHGWHVPRPDLAKKLGTPDTCLSCHSDKKSDWSAEKINQWFAESQRRDENHFSSVFSAIDNGYYKAASALSHVAQNKVNPPIIRASALERMAPLSDTNSLVAVARGAKDPNEYVRVAAARGGASIALKERWRILSPLLKDKVLAVRVEAAYSLLTLWAEFSQEQQSQLKSVLEEYLNIQDFNGDRGFAHNNKGTVYAYLGQMDKAEKAFSSSISIEPNFGQAYINLSELYRRKFQGSGNEQPSIQVLVKGMAEVPRHSEIPYRLGLAYIRAGKKQAATKQLAIAAERAPTNAQYHYVYGLSLEQYDLSKSLQQLRKAYVLSGDPRQLYALCDMQVRHNSFQARQCITELSKVAPANIVEKLKSQLSKN